MILILLVAIAYAAINYVRGRGMIPHGQHVVAPIAWAVVNAIAAQVLGYNFASTIAIAGVTFVGMLVWMVGIWKGWGGWGLYFASWTWIWNPNETEVPWIDAIGLKLVPFKTMAPHWTNGLRGTICMSIRGLYILPFFFMLSMPLLGVVIGLAQGVVYASMRWLAPATAGTKFAEPAYCFIVGAAVAHKLIMGF